MSTAETIPYDYQARARALRAKFFPPTPPVVISRPTPRIVEIIRPTYESVRKPRTVVVHGRVYGPHPIARDMWHLSSSSFERINERHRAGYRARQILREVAEEYGVTVEEMASPRRLMKFVTARQDAMARIYVQCTHLSLPSIAKLFNRDHTTVIHAVQKAGVWRGDIS